MATFEARDPSGRLLATVEVRRTDDAAYFGQPQWADDHRAADADAVVANLRDEAKGLAAATLSVAPGEELVDALRNARLSNTRMSRRISADSGGARYRPMTYDEFGEWRYANVAEYTENLLPRFGGDKAPAVRDAENSFVELLPKGVDTADTSLVIMLDDDDERVGTLWLRHHYEGPATFVCDLAVDADRRGQGWGRRALVAIDELASKAGDDRVTLNVFTENEVATRLYATGGFEPVLLTYDLLH